MSQRIPFLTELKQELLEHASGRVDSRLPQRQPRLSGPWIAAAVFVGVLVVGGLAWALRSDAPPVVDQPVTSEWDISVYTTPMDDVDALLAEINAIPGVVEARYVADIADLHPEMSAGSNVAAVFVDVDSPENAEAIATEINTRLEGIRITYSAEIAAIEAQDYFDFAIAHAAVLGENPLIVQPPPGPEPQFDTSDLGVEVSISPAESADEIADTFLTGATASRMEENALDLDRPVIHVGYLEETDGRLIVYGTVSNGFCVWVGEEFGTVSSCGDFSLYPFGVAMVGSGSPGNDGNVTVRVPQGTSVATLLIDGSERQWQRPHAGWAIFPLTVREPVQYTVEAYGATGNLIGRWEQTG